MRHWGPISAALHIVTFVALGVLTFEYGLVDAEVYNEVVKSGKTDTISLLAHLGRFDLISAILAMLGILVGVAAIFGFIEIRHTARETARGEAAEGTKKFLNEEAPMIIRRHVDLIASAGGGPNGDKVAEAYSEKEK